MYIIIIIIINTLLNLYFLYFYLSLIPVNLKYLTTFNNRKNLLRTTILSSSSQLLRLRNLGAVNGDTE